MLRGRALKAMAKQSKQIQHLPNRKNSIEVCDMNYLHI